MKAHVCSRTDHCKEVRVVDGALQVFASLEVRAVEDPGDGQTVVAPEGMNDHGATSISALCKHFTAVNTGVTEHLIRK